MKMFFGRIGNMYKKLLGLFLNVCYMTSLKSLLCLLLITLTPIQFLHSTGPLPLPLVRSDRPTQDTSFDFMYDDVVYLVDQIESGNLIKRCSLEELDKINDFLVFLARQGALDSALEEECFEYACQTGNHQDYELTSLILSGTNCDVISCSWVSDKWKSTKKFVEDHKKEILIGAAIVVGAAAVVGVIVLTSASGAAAGVGAVAAGVASKTNNDNVQVQVENSLQESCEEKIISFKESIVSEESSLLYADAGNVSFVEKTREFGSALAHDVVDEACRYASFFTELGDEVRDGIEAILPESDVISKESVGSPTENLKSLSAKTHEKIDQVFGTDRAQYYSPESNINDLRQGIHYGILPPPGTLPKGFSDTKKLAKAGKIADRGGFTKSGRALMKHGNRKGSVFPKPSGGPADMNRRGQIVLEEILNDPHNKAYQLKDGSLKVYSSDGRGAFFRKDGSFRGFIEKQYE